MRNALHQLEAKIADVETTLDLLTTQRRNALIQQRIHEALTHNHPSSYRHTDHFSTREDIEQQIQAIKQKNKQKPHSLPKNTLRRQTSPLTSSPPPLKREASPKSEPPHQTEPTTYDELDIDQLKTFLNLPND
jgi:phage shock protein A